MNFFSTLHTVFDREDALAVLGIAFVSRPFSNCYQTFSYCYQAFFLLFFFVVLTKVGSDWIRLDQIGSDWIRLDQIGSDRIR